MTVTEVQFLTGPNAQRWLRLAEGQENALVANRLLRKDLSADQARTVVEQVALRRRGADKFWRSNRMFFTKVGLEQATDEAVARYKASRFPIDSPGR
jgi:hypothetical protein